MWKTSRIDTENKRSGATTMEHQLLVGHYAPNPPSDARTARTQRQTPGEVPLEDSPEPSSERESLYDGIEKGARGDLDHSQSHAQAAGGEKEFRNAPAVGDYKPVPLKMWFLTLTLTIILILLALTELAVRLLPDGTKAAQPLYEVNATETETHALSSVSANRERDDQHEKRWDNMSSSTTSISSSQDGTKQLRICTTTVTLGLPPATTPEIWATVTQPTVTVTVDLNSTSDDTKPTTTTAPKSTMPTQPVSTSDSSCDTTVTVTITEALSLTRTTAITGTIYVTVGLNTVTVTIGEIQSVIGGSNGIGQTPTPVGVATPPVISTQPTPVAPDTPFTTVTYEDPPGQPTGGGNSISSVIQGPDTPNAINGPSSFPAGDGQPSIVGSNDMISGVGIGNQASPTPMSTMVLVSSMGSDGAIVVATKESVYLVMTSTFLVTSSGADGLVTTNTLASIITVPSKATQNGASGSAFLTEVIQTMTDSAGSAVATSTRLAYGSALLTTLTNSNGQGIATKTLDALYNGHTTVFTGTNGSPTGTATFFVLASTITMTDANGNSIGVSTSMMTVTPETSFVTDSRGSTVSTTTSLASATFPTPSIPTMTSNPSPGNTSDSDGKNEKVLKIYAITRGEYFVGLILPTLLATLLGIPIRIIHHHARLYQPFHALKITHGATAKQSLLFATTEWSNSITLLKSGQFLLPMTELLVLLSALLVPMSAEAVHIILQGDSCHPGQGSSNNCGITLGVFSIPAYICIGFLAAMVLLTIGVCIAASKYRTGVPRKPWNMSTLYELSSNNQLREILYRLPVSGGKSLHRQTQRVLGGYTYQLGNWSYDGASHYGILVNHSETPDRNHLLATYHNPPEEKSRSSYRNAMPIVPAAIYRALFLALLSGLLILIVVYISDPLNSSFDRFMDSESMGVRILFSGIGIIITMFWTSYFQYLSLLSPYRMVQDGGLRAKVAFNMNPPTNPFSGLFRVATGHHRDTYLSAVAATSIMSEFLPALLTNVPYRVIETYLARMVCTWLAVAILCVMILTVAGSFLVRWPQMVIQPNTLAGAMYYVAVPEALDALMTSSKMKGEH